jgi:hypothetical protein
MVDGWQKSSADESRDEPADVERVPWRAPVITRFALERTLSGGQSSGDGFSPQTD